MNATFSLSPFHAIRPLESYIHVTLVLHFEDRYVCRSPIGFFGPEHITGQLFCPDGSVLPDVTSLFWHLRWTPNTFHVFKLQSAAPSTLLKQKRTDWATGLLHLCSVMLCTFLIGYKWTGDWKECLFECTEKWWHQPDPTQGYFIVWSPRTDTWPWLTMTYLV